MIELTRELGMTDYFETKEYDRWWIYRATADGSIVDIIWAMANHRQQIDGLWMSGPEVNLRGHRVKVLPAEAMLWDKLYIVQRERCDWQDVFNLLYAAGEDVDWELLLRRIGEDTPLMAGALSVFRWLAPERAQRLPSWIWRQVGLSGDGYALAGSGRLQQAANRPPRPPHVVRARAGAAGAGGLRC